MQSGRRSRPVRWLAPTRVVAAAGALLLAASPAAASAQQLTATRTATVVRFSSEPALDLAAVPVVLRQPLTLRLHDVSLERALGEVMSRAGVSLTYSRSVVPLERNVSVSVENEPVVEALRQLLRGTDVELWISAEGRMALVPGERTTRAVRVAQTGTVAGTVTAAQSSEPLVGVTVTVLGTRLGAVTDGDGRYRIVNVPEGQQTLRAQRIGFGSDTTVVVVPDGGTVTADFSLSVLAVQLSEVVSIGYGETERRNLTGSVATVSSEEIESAPVPSIDQALLGRAAGVQVVTSSGQPGVVSTVRIRGGNSITAGNDPLYVIDGVPVTTNLSETTAGNLYSQSMRGVNPIAALSPNDIESIDILKDASATSIYGARAANGVILITTKRGRPEGAAVNIGAYYGEQEVRETLPVLNARQFATMVNTAYVNSGELAPFTQEEIAGFGAGTNWQDAIFRSAPMQNFDASISGGDEYTRFYLSGNVLESEGIVIGTDFGRKGARLNVDRTMSDRFRVGSSLTFSRTDANVLPNGGAGQEAPSIVLNAVMAPPTIPIRDANGEYFQGMNELTGRPFSNPVATALLITNEERQNRFLGNVYGEYDFMEGLTFRSMLGLDYMNSIQDFYSPSTTLPGRNFNGEGSRGQAETGMWLTESTLNYRTTLAGIHDVDLLGGLTLQRSRTELVGAGGRGFLTDALGQTRLQDAATFLNVHTGATEWSLVSYFSRANWSISDKYLFTLAGRIDGSTKFGENNRYGFFPSGAFAWRASEEDFVRELGWFDDLKLRIGYGRTGNQDIGIYRAFTTLGTTTYSFGGVRVTGYVPNIFLANADLQWETTDQLDIGADLAFLNNRVAVTTDVYEKRTSDLLLEVGVPRYTGGESQLQNIGSVRNRGFELSVTTVNLAGAFGWESQLNLAINRNEVTDLGDRTELFPGTGVGAGANQNPVIIREGEPLNSFYGYVFAGLDASGQPTYADLNGDNAVDDLDRRIIGSAQPDWTGGLTNRFTWRGFELSAFLQWSLGGEIYNINRSLLTTARGQANQLEDVLNAGTGRVPEPRTSNNFDTTPSDLFVEDGSYIRGKNIRLAYGIPASLLGRGALSGVRSAQVYVSAQNFFTVTDYTGFDPEISEYAGSNLAQGYDFGTYPQPRQITIGFTAGF